MEASQSKESAEREAAGAPRPDAAAAARAQRPATAATLLAWLLGLAAIALATALWYDVRGRIDATQEELARRLRDIESDARDARSIARDAQEALRETQARLALLESKLAESQSQQAALQALYQELSRNRDEWQLAEIEQVLEIAQQQLQLSGNVRAALLALRLAEARLSRSDRPQFLPIRQALTRDIERLKAFPALDLPALSRQLDGLAFAVDSLPLAAEQRTARPAARQPPGKVAAQGVLARFGAEVWGELRQLLVVRRLEHPEPPLLPPSQAYFARQNLTLLLLNARLSLLMRDEAGYREQLREAQAWIRRYFDPRAKQTASALAQLKQLASSQLSFETPSISDSLEAVRRFKALRERGPS
ncbi:MAG: uroporphyrinogen-III C-methyltransferase [Betaproteobacteria bacterium]|nr:uroporphyrinogen-III C-methyltransferase [Betaproteobacteria bacterium]